MLSQSQAIGSTLSNKVLETCASLIPLQQIISVIGEIMHNKENKVQSDHYLIGFVKHAEFKGALSLSYTTSVKRLHQRASHCRMLGIFGFGNQNLSVWRCKTKNSASWFIYPLRTTCWQEASSIVWITTIVGKAKSIPDSSFMQWSELVLLLGFLYSTPS